MIARPCALLPDAVKEATCGELSKLIAAASGVFTDAVDFLLGVTEVILKATGVWQIGDTIVGWVSNTWDKIFGDGLKHPKVCGPAKDYFARNYMPCLAAAVGASSASAPDLGGQCVAHFDDCYKDPKGICDGMAKALADQAKPINDALEQGAQAYSPAIGAFIHSRREQMCGFGYEKDLGGLAASAKMEFARECQGALAKQRPLNTNTCGDKRQRPANAAHFNACFKAIDEGNVQGLIASTCKSYCEENRDNCAPTFRAIPCVPTHLPASVAAYGFEYVPTEMQRMGALMNWCRVKPWSIFDKIHWPEVVNPNPIINWHYDWDSPINVVTVTKIPRWGFPNAGGPADSPLGGLAVGNCKPSRTILSPTATWSSGRAALVLREPAQDFSQLLDAVMARPQPAPRLQLSINSTALVTGGFDSCAGTGGVASRGSSGSDGSFSPNTPVVKRSGSGGAAAIRGSSSGSYGVQNNPMDNVPGIDSLSGVSGNKAGVFTGGGSGARPACPTCGTVKTGSPKPTAPTPPAQTSPLPDVDYGGMSKTTPSDTYLK
jgi:hypothetical protein